MSTSERTARLDALTRQAESVILARQDAGTGLLPASTAVTVHGDYTHAWVRDNVYSIVAVWALALAWRGHDAARAQALAGRVEHLMRGLLAAMMKQAHKVERFKHTQDPLDALHAKYATTTGEPVVGDDAWGHLQIDATAIFVLMLARMNATGLVVVRDPHEVAFVQNLVHYLSQAWRTPDFGIWERGHKRNEGVAEINASSVGMAKAALQAIAGFEPLPGQCPPVQVLEDDVAHARETLEGLLPRESASKETDAALLAVIGFPAFAVDDAALAARTRAEIVGKLEGRHGCKRFLRDGHQTTIEDHARLHYEPGELQRFEHIESEWPLFFTYLLIDAVLAGDDALAAHYRESLDALAVERDGQWLLPELYRVPLEAVEAERAAPQSQPREPNENVPLVWAQSLYLTGVLLQEGFVDAAALRPPEAPRTAVTVQVALIAADALVQARLTAAGIASELPERLGPARVLCAQSLQSALAGLGRDESLGLSGRPMHRLGSLTTSVVYTLGGELRVMLPAIFDRPGFYLRLDNRLLVDEIGAEIAYLRRHWRAPGRPLLALWVSEPMLRADAGDTLLGFLHALPAQEGIVAAPLAEGLRHAERRLIGWTDALATAEPIDSRVGDEADATALTWDDAATRVLAAPRLAALEREEDAALQRALGRSRNPYEQVAIAGVLWRRHGPEAECGAPGGVRGLVGALYRRAARERRWGLLRRAAALLGIHDPTLEDALALIVAQRRRVALGPAWREGAIVDRPLASEEIARRLREAGGEPRAAVLVQELLLLLGTLVKTDAALLEGTLTVRPWHLLELLAGWLAREHGLGPGEAVDHLLELRPQAILHRLREVLLREQEMAHALAAMKALPAEGAPAAWVAADTDAHRDPPLPDDEGGWVAWRELAGTITRMPEAFFARVWALLGHFPGLVIGDALDSRSRLDSALARADTTPAEIGFAIQVEDRLNTIQDSAYRQLTIEAIDAVAAVCRANPALRVQRDLVTDVLLDTAVGLAAGPEGMAAPAQAWQAFYALPPRRVARLVESAFEALLAAPAAPAAPDDPGVCENADV